MHAEGAIRSIRCSFNNKYIYIIRIILYKSLRNYFQSVYMVWYKYRTEMWRIFIVRVYLTLIRFLVTLYVVIETCAWIKKEKKRVVSATCLYSVYIRDRFLRIHATVVMACVYSGPFHRLWKKKEIRKKELTRKINIIVNKYEVLYLPYRYICIRDQNACVQV